MKFRTSALLTAAVMFAAVSCTTKPVQPRLGTIVIDTLLGDTTRGFRVEYNFATILNADDSPALKAVEESVTGYFFELEDFTGTAAEAADSTLRQIAAELLPADAGEFPALGAGEISVEAECAVVDTLLTYAITRWSFTGGAHGIYGTECHNYSLREGYELTTADLFSEAQFKQTDSLIRTKLYAQYETTNDEGLTAAGFFPEYISITENFLISEEGITFYYNPYEIGCYALGGVEVTITPDELARIKK